MVYIYNPFLLDLEVNESNTKTDFTFSDVYCRESTKKMQENAEKGYRRIPLVTVKTFAENRDGLSFDDLSELPAYISSFKKENKNGKLNITARITECKEEAKSDVGFIAAIPIRGYIEAIQFDSDIEPLKMVLKYVDKFEFNGENYTQVIYVVGRAAKKISNLLGYMAFESRAISKGDVVTTYRTEVVFQNEDIRQETNVIKTETGEEAVKEAVKAATETKDFTTSANTVVEPFAKEFKPNDNNRKNFKSNNNSHGGFKGELIIPEYQGNERDRNSRGKKKRRK